MNRLTRVLTFAALLMAGRSAVVQSQAKGQPVQSPLDKGRTMNIVADGPAPTNVQVRSYDPTLQLITWSSSMAHTADVYRRTGPVGAWVQVNKTPITIQQCNDTVTLAPNSATYRIVLHYQNGKTGLAEVPAGVTLQPAPVTVLTAVQDTPEGQVSIWWKPVDKAQGYRILGPGQVPGGKLVTKNIDTLIHVPVGNQTFTVWPVYAGPLENPPRATVSLKVFPRSGHYRITILGFRADTTTVDDPLQVDGKGDEIFVAAQVLRYKQSPNLSSFAYQNDYKVVKSDVYGDVNGHPGRVQAGSLSAKGGIKSGDMAPADPAAPTNSPQATRLPLLVWDGTMTYHQDILIVVPTIWEWDGNAKTYNFWTTLWDGYARSPVGITDYLIRDQIGNPSFGWGFLRKTSMGFGCAGIGDQGPGFDRPVGLQPCQGLMGINDVGLALSQERLETMFDHQQTTRIVGQIAWADYSDVNGCGTLCGHYTMWIQLERLP